jgi:cell division septation protein DedD
LRLADRLQGWNLILSEAWVRTAADGQEELVVRVRVGPFADRATAMSKLRELRASGYRPFVLAGRE